MINLKEEIDKDLETLNIKNINVLEKENDNFKRALIFANYKKDLEVYCVSEIAKNKEGKWYIVIARNFKIFNDAIKNFAETKKELSNRKKLEEKEWRTPSTLVMG